MTKTRKKMWENRPWESTMKQFQIFKAPLLIIAKEGDRYQEVENIIVNYAM